MMCIGTYLWATAISLLAATFILHMYDRKYVRDLKKRSSRYELFEIRDALVLLIAQGKMTEEDPAWKYVYRSVNRLLDLRNEMNIRDFFLQYSRFTFLLQRDENARKRLDEVRGEIRRSIESCAEFGETEQKVDRALQAMVMHQTSAWHFWTLAAFIATRIVCEAAFKVVRRARRPRDGYLAAISSAATWLTNAFYRGVKQLRDVVAVLIASNEMNESHG